MKRQILLGIAVIAIVATIGVLNRASHNTPVNADIQVQDNSMKDMLYPKAKEIVDPAGFINTNPFNISEYIGKKIIMVDFWTYSCINCQRTLPYLTVWDAKYRDQGLLIIGVHTPEFDFEKDYNNVLKATEKFGVKYPVVLDNDYQTWRAYNNRYWPRKYIIDIDGYIVYDHIGEGGYDETEMEIQKLLKERAQRLGLDEQISTGIAEPTQAPSFAQIRTPELYVGYGRGTIGNTEGYSPGETIDYAYPQDIKPDTIYLQGKWLNMEEYMELAGPGSLELRYKAKDVNLVLGADQPISVGVYLDGELLKTIEVSDEGLYNLVSGTDYSEHTVEIRSGAGLRAFAFTFG